MHVISVNGNEIDSSLHWRRWQRNSLEKAPTGIKSKLITAAVHVHRRKSLNQNTFPVNFGRKSTHRKTKTSDTRHTQSGMEENWARPSRKKTKNSIRPKFNRYTRSPRHLYNNNNRPSVAHILIKSNAILYNVSMYLRQIRIHITCVCVRCADKQQAQLCGSENSVRIDTSHGAMGKQRKRDAKGRREKKTETENDMRWHAQSDFFSSSFFLCSDSDSSRSSYLFIFCFSAFGNVAVLLRFLNFARSFNTLSLCRVVVAPEPTRAPFLFLYMQCIVEPQTMATTKWHTRTQHLLLLLLVLLLLLLLLLSCRRSIVSSDDNREYSSTTHIFICVY